MRSGRKSEAQTPSPKKDRIYGSKTNPKGSASSSKSASNIEFTESIINTLENKRDEYNAKHPNKKVTLATLKAVFRRGAGAFSSSHRPNMTRSGWAFARVNKFLLKKGGTKVKAAYVQDDDLMERGGLIKKQLEGTLTKLGREKYIVKGDYKNQANHTRELKNILSSKGLKEYSYEISPSTKSYYLEYANDKCEISIRLSNHTKASIFDDGEYEFIDSSVDKNGYLRAEIYICSNEDFEDAKKWIQDNIQYDDLMEKGGALYHLGGDMSKHLAPNGKSSNLTHEQWHLVRTPEFKAWFGDWENDPQNASKVVDENGEPLVVYHGSKKNFTEFRKDKLIWVTPDQDYILKMSGLVGENTFELFANARKVIDLSSYGYKYYDQQTAYEVLKNYGIEIQDILIRKMGALFYVYIQEFQDEIKSQLKILGYDGIKLKVHRNFDYAYAFFDSNQVKLADGSNTKFDASNPDIRYEDGGIIDETYNKVLQGAINSDDGAIYLYENGIEVTDDIYDRLRDGEQLYIKKGKGLQVGDIITIKGKYGNSDFKGNFRGYTNEGKLIVVYEGGKQMAINKDEYYEHGGLLKKAPSILKIADKHHVELETIQNALKDGIKVEMEHTKNRNVAKTIASHHLYESPKYYEKLKIMEKELNLDEHYEDIKKIYAIGGVVDPVLSFSTPTGEPSKLTYLQQILVRTSAFKKFFGDWEYAGKRFVESGRQEYEYLYRNVSKVIDKMTLEPKVVYHGTRVDSEFYVFDVSQQSGDGRPYGYFAHNIEYSQNFTTSSQRGMANAQPFLYKCFVNIRNPFYAMTSEYYDIQEDAQYWKNEIAKTIALDKYTNELDSNKLDKIKQVVESQIGKYIDDTFGFNQASFWLLMARDKNKLFKYFLNTYRYDGIFYAEEFGGNYDVDNPSEFTEAVTIFEPSQVKLADGRNLNFDPMNVDIRYEKGGDTDNVENTQEKYNNMGKRENLRNLLLGDKYAEGGEVVANKLKDGNDGKKGGYFEGRSHDNGGIKAYNKDTGQMIEVEGEEVIITKGAVKDPQKREFEGEMLTNREILSRINQSGGGVSFAEGGEMKSSSCGCSGKKYKYGGEMMDDYSIVKIMNRPFEIINDNFADARAFADMLVEKLK